MTSVRGRTLRGKRKVYCKTEALPKMFSTFKKPVLNCRISLGYGTSFFPWAEAILGLARDKGGAPLEGVEAQSYLSLSDSLEPKLLGNTKENSPKHWSLQLKLNIQYLTYLIRSLFLAFADMDRETPRSGLELPG